MIALLKLVQDSGFTDPSKPTTTGWEVLGMGGVRDIEYTINLDPEKVAAWRAEQERKQLLHKIK